MYNLDIDTNKKFMIIRMKENKQMLKLTLDKALKEKQKIKLTLHKTLKEHNKIKNLVILLGIGSNTN